MADKNMLAFLDLLKESGKIRFDKEFCDAIGLKQQNLINIKKGRAHFTPEHISETVKNFNANANWILGASDQIFLNGRKNR